MTFYSNCNNSYFKAFLCLLMVLPLSLSAQIKEETLFYNEGVRYTSIKTLVLSHKDCFFATNLFFNEVGSDNSNFVLYKMSQELEKIDSVVIEFEYKFNEYDFKIRNDSILIFTMKVSLNDNESIGEVIIYNEALEYLDRHSIFLHDVSGSQTRRIYVENDDEGGYLLYASISSMNHTELWLYSARLSSNFEVIETDKFSIRTFASVASNVVKYNNDYYFIALELFKSEDGLENWEKMPVEGIDDLFYYPCQFIEFNDHLVVASQLINFIHRRGLIVEFVNTDLKVVKSNIYFEQFDGNDNLSYLSNTQAVIKNPAGDRVVIAGQNGFSIGNTFDYPKVNVPSNLFFVQYDDDFNEIWVQVLEGDAFYFMDGGIRYLTDDKIIGSGFKYVIEEDKFYGFIIMLDSETGDLISNVNTHSITPERLKIYPNPVVEQLNIDLPVSDWVDYENYSIINIQGAVLRQEALTDRSIAVGDLPSGQYVLLLHGRGKVAVGKFVKM